MVEISTCLLILYYPSPSTPLQRIMNSNLSVKHRVEISIEKCVGEGGCWGENIDHASLILGRVGMMCA